MRTARDPGPLVAAACDALVRQRVLERVVPEDEPSWIRHQVASVFETQTGKALEPERVEDPSDPRWAVDVADLQPIDSPYASAFWLLREARRVGTLAIGTSGSSGDHARLTALFVHPRHRRQGIASRALRLVRAAVGAVGLRSTRIGTDWWTQPSVRLFLGLGMWSRMWKHELSFVDYVDRPPWRLAVVGAEARFLVGESEVIVARRIGDALEWRVREGVDWDLARESERTCALALAMAGFPLTEPGAPRKLPGSDGGGPQELAGTIQHLEAWALHNGWHVDAPRIPGLAYPTWEELDEP